MYDINCVHLLTPRGDSQRKTRYKYHINYLVHFQSKKLKTVHSNTHAHTTYNNFAPLKLLTHMRFSPLLGAHWTTSKNRTIGAPLGQSQRTFGITDNTWPIRQCRRTPPRKFPTTKYNKCWLNIPHHLVVLVGICGCYSSLIIYNFNKLISII